MSNIIGRILAAFQTYDTPTEAEFADLIVMAGSPTVFTRRSVTPVVDALTDINAEVFELGIREVFIIEYGPELYLLTSSEGTHGLGGTPFVASDLILFKPHLPPLLEFDLKPTEYVGGISPTDFFPKDITTIEAVLRKMLVANAVSGLSYSVSVGSASSLLLVGTLIQINNFVWAVKGTPTKMRITDSGPLDIPVTGTSHAVSLPYKKDVFGSETWTLHSDDGSTTNTTKWMNNTYVGKSTNSAPPTNIGLGLAILKDTSSTFNVAINTTAGEYGWVAIHKAQSKSFTRYYMSDFNQGTISNTPGSSTFYRAGDVMFNGQEYEIFMMPRASEIATVKFI